MEKAGDTLFAQNKAEYQEWPPVTSVRPILNKTRGSIFSLHITRHFLHQLRTENCVLDSEICRMQCFQGGLVFRNLRFAFRKTWILRGRSRRCAHLINSLSISYPIDKATPSEHSEGVLIILSFSSISLLRTC